MDGFHAPAAILMTTLIKMGVIRQKGRSSKHSLTLTYSVSFDVWFRQIRD
jgi:hypothetical protein